MNSIFTATVFCFKVAALASIVSLGVAVLILLIGKILSRGSVHSAK